ncbi:hypothetical protein [Aeromicrobium sp. CTD01-1L150]|uniref:hypothetical protein n=1 Tax=Aeromicrobium sp. CTD01-1L150 TaxID=3341830 RepID=UPI0035BEF79E
MLDTLTCMSWVFTLLGVIVAVVTVLVVAIMIWLAAVRRRLRRQIALQAEQAAEYPAWAREHGYSYSEDFPETDTERIQGLGPLMPFSDFVFSRAEHVFRGEDNGQMRYLLQLTVFSDPGPDVRPRGALTVAVAEVPRSEATADVREPAASRGQASVHAHGRWVSSYRGGPLTFDSMTIVESRLDEYLQRA